MTAKDELTSRVSQIFSHSWDIREGRTVPSNDQVTLKGGGVRLDATVLYSDLSQSSKLATDFTQKTAAKVIQAFLSSMCYLISYHGGTITSFDGDRVMGIFIGDSKNSSAAKCALNMNYAVTKIIEPKVANHFSTLKKEGFDISHCVGIDTSPVLAVSAGQRGSNDLVWVGRAPNLAAKLSGFRQDSYSTFISEDVFSKLNESAIYSPSAKEHMWEKRSIKFLDESIIAYRSSWWWDQ